MLRSSDAFIHPTALVFGKVSLGAGASLWPYAVIRAEQYDVAIGNFSNIQDFVMVHVGSHQGTAIGDYCSIAHHCTIHGATIGNNCLIGINATIMDGARLGDNCIVAGHTLIREGTVIPANSVVMGTPGKVVRQLDDPAPNVANALAYHRNAIAYAAGDHRAWDGMSWEDLRVEARRILAGDTPPR